MTPSEVEQLLKGLERTGNLPKGVTASSLKEMSKSLAKYFNKISADKISEFADNAKSVLEQALNSEQEARPGTHLTTTVGDTLGSARGKLLEFLQDNGAENIGKTMNLDFFLRIPQEIALGASKKLTQNWDQERVDEYPALEFHRVYGREVPRGSEKDPAGPENAWDDADGRWIAACDESGDDDAAKVFEDTGRCVALKSSGVWEALGDGAGGYDDTLGNDFAPFAFNSGWDTDEVPYDEAVELGLLDEGEAAEPAETDFSDLLNLEARRFNPSGQALNGSRTLWEASGATTKPHPGDKNASEAVLGGSGALESGDFAEELHPRDKDGKFSGVAFKQSKGSERHGDEVVVADVEKMDREFKKNKEQYIGPGGEGGIGKRYEGVKDFLKKGEPVEMSEVNLGPDKDIVQFNNGRHRWAVLRDQGVKKMPVSVLKEHAADFKERFGA